MKLALTLLLVGIAQSQTLLNTLRNLGAADSSNEDGTSLGPPTTDIHNPAQVHTGNIVILLEAQKQSEEENKIMDAEADDAKKAIDLKALEDKNAIDLKALEDKKAIDVQSAAKKKEKYERERINQSDLLQELLMQKPKRIPGFSPSEYAQDTFKKLGGLNYQELVGDNIVEEPTQPVTIKLNFKKTHKYGLTKYFEFAQVNLDDQLHGFARYFSGKKIYEAEFRNGWQNGFSRVILKRRLSTNGDLYDYKITWTNFAAQLSYLTGQNTPKLEANNRQLNARNNEAFEKIKIDGPSNYFMNQGNI